MEKHQEMDSIGNRIRALRLACGITQSELGRRIGISAPAITQLERSLSRMPKGFVLAGLCRELSTNSAWLLNGQGDPSATVALDGDRHDLVMLYESLPSQGRDLLMAQARMLQGSFARKVD
jgi:transcriptional regulator with XRE-family HTH domain